MLPVVRVSVVHSRRVEPSTVQRLGCLEAVTNELVRVTTAGPVSSETMCDLLHKIAALGLAELVTLVLGNARSQRCDLVMHLPATRPIWLQFLPSYSPNLDLIERLCKFVKRDVLYGRHYNTFTAFCAAIDDCLDKFPTKHRPHSRL